MPKFSRDLFFILGWLFFLIEILLLGESQLNYVLIGGLSLFLLLFSNQLSWKNANKHSSLFILWMIYLGGVAVSFLFTWSLPLSLAFLSKWLLAFLVFWFVLLGKKFLSKDFIINSLLTVGISLTIFSVLFYIFPALLDLLPSMNLVYATYGHNHLAALLILLLPLSWWWVEKHRGWYRYLLPLIFTLGLMFSFGRLAILIVFVQLVFIYRHMTRKSLSRKVLSMSGWLIGMTILVKLFFTFAPLIDKNYSCPFPNFETQICKSLLAEKRLDYWQWALQIGRENWLVGTGPGTYQLAALKYRSAPFFSTDYAHNVWLQMWAETGLVGLVSFTLFTGYLLYWLWKKTQSDKKLSLEKMVFLSMIGTYVNVLFDFDWEFTGILLVSFILLALVLDTEKLWSQKISSRLIKVTYYLVSIILMAFATLYLVTSYLIKHGQPLKAFKLFPYFNQQQNDYFSNNTLLNSQKDELVQIYVHSPQAYSMLLRSETDPERVFEYKKRLIALDPWERRNYELLTTLRANNEWHQLENEIMSTLGFWSFAEKNTTFQPTHQDKVKLATLMMDLGDEQYLNGEYAKAGRWYVQAQQTYEWAMVERDDPAFEIVPRNEVEALDFYSVVSSIDEDKFGVHREYFVEAYYQVLVAVQDEIEIKPHVENIIGVAEWWQWEIKERGELE